MKTIFTVLILALSLGASAQSNFYKFSIGAGGGVTQSFADLKKHAFGTAGYGTLDYLFTPFISLGLEAQMGEINGGDQQTEPSGRQFINGYKSITANGKIALGQLVDYERSNFLNSIKGLYFGAGLGIIQNKMKGIIRYKADPKSSTGLYKFPGTDESKDISIPLNLGINFYFPNHYGYYRYGINVNYQANITLGEGLDGYDDSTWLLKNGSPDIYTYFTIGFRYYLGPVGLSKKTFISY